MSTNENYRNYIYALNVLLCLIGCKSPVNFVYCVPKNIIQRVNELIMISTDDMTKLKCPHYVKYLMKEIFELDFQAEKDISINLIQLKQVPVALYDPSNEGTIFIDKLNKM
eukprot:283675_1